MLVAHYKVFFAVFSVLTDNSGENTSSTAVFFDNVKVQMQSCLRRWWCRRITYRTYLAQKLSFLPSLRLGNEGLGLCAESCTPHVNQENRFTFNGKEKQTELGLHQYDFSARSYDYQILRTTTLDPHGDSYVNVSGYSFLNNNPLRFIDPTGRDVTETAWGTSYTGVDAQNMFRQLRDIYTQKTTTSYTLNQDYSHTLTNVTVQEVISRKDNDTPVVKDRITTTTSITTKIVDGEIVSTATQKVDRTTIEISRDKGKKTYSSKVISNSMGELKTIDVADVKGDLKGFQYSLEQQLQFNPDFNPFSSSADIGGDGNFVLGGLSAFGAIYDGIRFFADKLLPSSGGLGIGIAILSAAPWFADIYRKNANHKGRSAILKETKKVTNPN
jgi:RHS repeat-associated protein